MHSILRQVSQVRDLINYHSILIIRARLTLAPGSIETRVGLVQQSLCLVYIGVLSSLSIFPGERNLFFHERKSNARHSPAVFIAAYTVQESLLALVSSLGFTLVMSFG